MPTNHEAGEACRRLEKVEMFHPQGLQDLREKAFVPEEEQA